MQNAIREVAAVEQSVVAGEQDLLELNELQLALVGGGIADVVFG